MKRAVFAVIGCLLLAVGARADTVFFKSKTSLECKVVGDMPEGLLVILDARGKSSLVLDRSTILRIEYDFASRLKALRKQERENGKRDYRAHYELGLWAEERGLYDQKLNDRALNQYLAVVGKPGVPDEAYLHLGRMYEKSKEPNLGEALRAYQTYLQAHPESAEAAAAVARLTKRLAQNPEAANPKPAAPSGKEGMETRTWFWDRWSNKGTVRNVLDTGNKSNVVLELSYTGGGKDKASFKLTGKNRRNDLSQKKAIVMDVFNPGQRPLQIGIAVVTGNHEWFESTTKTVPPGKWTLGVRFDLTRKQWKSKATNWVHRTQPANLNNTRRIHILLHNGRENGKIYLDNFGFEDPK